MEEVNMSPEELKNIYPEYFTPALAKASQLLIEKGEGPYLFTTDGEKYLDLVQGIAVNALGHAHPALVEAACSQGQEVDHASFNLVNYPSALQLAVLCETDLVISTCSSSPIQGQSPWKAD
jgi:acetylornithine/succinyldiaminopimelate/putrescine aminotransferase